MAAKQKKKVIINPDDYPVPEGYPVYKVVLQGKDRGKLILALTNVDNTDYTDDETNYSSDITRPLTQEEQDKYIKREKIF